MKYSTGQSGERTQKSSFKLYEVSSVYQYSNADTRYNKRVLEVQQIERESLRRFTCSPLLIRTQDL
jgi:hypothetical protein